jgi:hypothetical protein
MYTHSLFCLEKLMDKWDYMKVNSFCTTKEMVSKLKRPLTEWEKIFVIHQTTDQNIQGTQKTELPQNQWTNKEVSNWNKQNIFRGRSTNGQKTKEKILTIPDHKGNANQNHPKIPPHSCQNYNHQDTPPTTNVGKNAWTLLMGMSTSTITMENSMETS